MRNTCFMLQQVARVLHLVVRLLHRAVVHLRGSSPHAEREWLWGETHVRRNADDVSTKTTPTAFVPSSE